jgi:UDP-N-acetylglucosamine transferase subunit ALG13
MIFVTVGTQLPFDRMIKLIDKFSEENRNLEIVAQIGNASYYPKNFEYYNELSISEFDDLFDKASLIISHAGMGSILTALSKAKPILIMPRRFEFREHRNDHQLATVDKFAKTDGCFVFNNDIELKNAYNLASNCLYNSKLSEHAPESMLNALESIFIEFTTSKESH